MFSVRGVYSVYNWLRMIQDKHEVNYKYMLQMDQKLPICTIHGTRIIKEDMNGGFWLKPKR